MAVFLFHGEDTYSHRQKLKFWQKEFERKHGGDMNISTFAGDKVSAQDIFQASCAMPFLGEKRLVIVKNFLSEGDEEARAAFTDLVEKIPDFCVLVFSEMGDKDASMSRRGSNGLASPKLGLVDKRIGLYKKIVKIGTLTEFPPMAGSRLLGWIDKEVTARGGVIEKEALIVLSEIVGADLYRLENEISKLVAYAGGTVGERNARAITKRDVELLVESQLTASIFRMTDGMGQKNARLALTTLHQLIETGEDLHRIFYMVMRQFRLITWIKDLAAQGMRRDEITRHLKEHPFVISNTLSQSGNFSFDQLRRVYDLLLDLDTRIKTGGIKTLAGDNRELVLAMDRLVLKLCA